MTHRNGELNEEVHKTAYDAFLQATEIARDLKLYGAGQDLLTDTFSGNVKGMGPGCAEMEFKERGSDPVIVYCMDKTEPGAFNLPIFRIFADPFNTAGLVIDPSLHEGFSFEVFDVMEHKKVILDCPEEMYDLLALIGSTGRYVIKRVFKKNGPMMPTSQEEANPIRFDGPPRVVGLGFQVTDAKLIGPVDLFDDPAFDETRRQSANIASYIRRHGPFEPHRLPSEEMEYTSLPGVMEKLEPRFEDMDD